MADELKMWAEEPELDVRRKIMVVLRNGPQRYSGLMMLVGPGLDKSLGELVLEKKVAFIGGVYYGERE